MQEGFVMMMVQSIAALAVVLALFAALIWGFRKLQFRQMPAGSTAMRVVQRLSVDTRCSLVEVEHGGRRYLLGISPSGMSVVSNREYVTGSDSGSDQNET